MVLAIFLAVVVGIASVAIYFYLGSLIHHRTVNGLQQAGASENILLVGSTTRCGLKHQDRHYGLCSLGVTGVNSDVTMIVHLDPSTGKVSLLSIPRDLFVPNARIEGANKIDAALYQGPSQLVSAIEEDFGIPINHFVELNFDSFASVVDAIGGVWMYFPRPVYDAESFLNIRSIGCHYLNGYHALQVVRARHLQIKPIGGSNNHATWPQEAQSDLARIRRTHEFLRVLAAAVSAKGIGNPSTDLNLATSVLPNLTVDQTFSENHMLSLAETFATVSIGTVPQLTYPVLVDLMNGYQNKGGSYGDVAFPIQPGGFQTINQVFGTSADQSTWDGHALPNPSSFSVAVLNGTGIAHQASVVADALRVRGYSISATGDRTPVGPLAETVVWYGGPPPPKSGESSARGCRASRRAAPRPGHHGVQPPSRDAGCNRDDPNRLRPLDGAIGSNRNDHHDLATDDHVDAVEHHHAAGHGDDGPRCSRRRHRQSVLSTVGNGAAPRTLGSSGL